MTWQPEYDPPLDGSLHNVTILDFNAPDLEHRDSDVLNPKIGPKQPSSRDSERNLGRITAEFPVVDDEVQEEDWCCMHGAQMARMLAYHHIDVEPLQALRGFETVHIVHVASGTVVQAIPNASWQGYLHNDAIEPIFALTRISTFQKLTLDLEPHIALVGTIQKQPEFVYILILNAETANYAMANARLRSLFG